MSEIEFITWVKAGMTILFSFLIGLMFGVVLSPRKSLTELKIDDLRVLLEAIDRKVTKK